MRGLQRASLNMLRGVGSSIRRIGVLFTGVFGGLAAFGAAKILSGIFKDATMEAEQANQRTRSLTQSLMRINSIRAKGEKYAKGQVDLIFKHNEVLAKTGVLHQDILDTTSMTMAQWGFGPKLTAQMAQPMADLLAHAKGVSATEEDAAGMATAVSKFVTQGKVKALQSYGIIFGNEVEMARISKLSWEKRLWYVNQYAAKLKGANARLRETPEGRVKLLSNELKDMSQRIGKEILPMQAKMADAWRSILPTVEPLLLKVQAAGMTAMTGLAGWVETTGLPAFQRFAAWIQGPFAEAWSKVMDKLWPALEKIGAAFAKMFGSVVGEGKDFATTMGDLVVKALEKLATVIEWVGNNSEWLVPLVTTLTVAFYAASVAIGVMNAVLAISPIGWIIIGIGALIAALVLLIKYPKEIAAWCDTMWEKFGKMGFIGVMLKSTFGPIYGLIKVITWLAQVDWGAVWQGLKDTWDALLGWMKDRWDALKKNLNPLELAKKAGGAISGAAGSIWGGAKKLAGFASGGVVTKPTVAMVGEKGPEAIVPLGRSSSKMQFGAAFVRAWQKTNEAILKSWDEYNDSMTGTIDDLKGSWDKFTKTAGSTAMATGQAVGKAFFGRGVGGGGGGVGGGGGFGGAGAGSKWTDYAAPEAGALVGSLADVRKNYAAELQKPDVMRAMFQRTSQEVGTGTSAKSVAAQQAFMEELFNRAAARKQSLSYAIHDPKYYPEPVFNKSVGEKTAEAFKGILGNVQAGSNINKWATGNASGTVGFGGGPQTLNVGERFGIEKGDMPWAKRMMQVQADAAKDLTKAVAGVPPMLAAPGAALGGIVKRHSLIQAGEGNRPEAIIPMTGGRGARGLLNHVGKALGMRPAGGHTLHFNPIVTINGNASEDEQRAMDSRLRGLASDFIRQFKAAQTHERRLSFESGYG